MGSELGRLSPLISRKQTLIKSWSEAIFGQFRAFHLSLEISNYTPFFSDKLIYINAMN